MFRIEEPDQEIWGEESSSKWDWLEIVLAPKWRVNTKVDLSKLDPNLKVIISQCDNILQAHCNCKSTLLPVILPFLKIYASWNSLCISCHEISALQPWWSLCLVHFLETTICLVILQFSIQKRYFTPHWSLSEAIAAVSPKGKHSVLLGKVINYSKQVL